MIITIIWRKGALGKLKTVRVVYCTYSENETTMDVVRGGRMCTQYNNTKR